MRELNMHLNSAFVKVILAWLFSEIKNQNRDNSKSDCERLTHDTSLLLTVYYLELPTDLV